jgi:hypothetical protein
MYKTGATMMNRQRANILVLFIFSTCVLGPGYDMTTIAPETGTTGFPMSDVREMLRCGPGQWNDVNHENTLYFLIECD